MLRRSELMEARSQRRPDSKVLYLPIKAEIFYLRQISFIAVQASFYNYPFFHTSSGMGALLS